MNDKIKNTIIELEKVGEDAKTSFGGLTEEQLNWKPEAKSWSVAQCLDHLIRSNVEFDDEWPKLIAGNRKNSFIENWSPLTGFWGSFLIRSMINDKRKSKAPSRSIVPPSDIEPGIVGRFTANIEDLCGKIERCDRVDLDRTVLTSPFLRIVTYRLGDAFDLLVEHSKRHVRQAKRVVETQGFPA